MADERLYGVLAEFETPEALVEAARQARREGYRDLDAFTPFPVEELTEVLRLRDRRVPWLGLFGACFGAALALAMQLFTNFDYPINVGGRPLYAWSAFAVVTFELTVLFAALTPAFGMLALNGLPRLHHPVFGATRFHLASQGSLLPVRQGRRSAIRRGRRRRDFLQAARRVVGRGGAAMKRVLSPSLAICARGRGLRPEHDFAAEVRRIRAGAAVPRRPGAAGAGRRHGGARRSRARRRSANQAAADAAAARARPRAVRHLLLAVPRPGRQRRRHDRRSAACRGRRASTTSGCAGEPTSISSTSSPTAMASCIPTRPRAAARPLGHRRLYPRAAIEPARRARRRAADERARLCEAKP